MTLYMYMYGTSNKKESTLHTCMYMVSVVVKHPTISVNVGCTCILHISVCLCNVHPLVYLTVNIY